MSKKLFTALFFILMGCFIVSDALAAAPHILVFHDGLLDAPVVMSQWEENYEFMVALEEISIVSEELAERPYVEIALFWGGQWQRYFENQVLVEVPSTEQATQSGRFYPATDNDDPLIILDQQSGRAIQQTYSLNPTEQRLLEQYGVPTTIVSTLPSKGKPQGSRTNMLTIFWVVAGIGVFGMGYRK